MLLLHMMFFSCTTEYQFYKTSLDILNLRSEQETDDPSNEQELLKTVCRHVNSNNALDWQYRLRLNGTVASYFSKT
jgi:hypothetical protein